MCSELSGHSYLLDLGHPTGVHKEEIENCHSQS